MKIFKKLNLLYGPESFWGNETVDIKNEKAENNLNTLTDKEMEDTAPNKQEFADFKNEMEDINWAEQSEIAQDSADRKKWLNSMMEAILAQAWMSKEEFEASNKFA